MKAIYSKVEEGVLLHKVHRLSEIKDGRNDLVKPEEFIQVSALKMPEGKTFPPHKHNVDNKETTITQESWVILKGKVKAIFYDLDNTIIAEEILEQGDLSITLRGGHTYLILEDDTMVYEFKTGPYFGQERDKTFI